MNCQKFETLVSELARGQMMAAQQRAEALAHSDVCDDCATRLQDEQMLTLGLQSLTAEMEPLEAPPHVEALLLETFRAREVVVPIAKRQSNSRYWLAAVAAMLLIAISVIVFSWSKRPAADRHEAVRQEAPQPKPEIKNNQNEHVRPEIEKSAVADSFVQHPRSRKIRPVSSRRADTAAVANHVTKEIATDFIPLSYMSAASLQEGGQIMRVQLPRSALANFGLPVNMDRYNEKVKADVLYGVDGTARAIRFVQ